MQMKIDMVIHGDYGGFSLTDEIVERLREQGCTWVDQCMRTDGSDPRWYPEAQLERDNSFRQDPIFVGVIRELQGLLDRDGVEMASWKDRRTLERRVLNGLRVVGITVEIEIEDDDGKESVHVFGGAW
jgi:hypothetical protein